MPTHFILTTLLLIIIPQECFTQNVNFTTQPPPGSNSILLYGKCNNADEDISAICSWPEDPFGFQPRLDISYPNGSSEAVSAGNADRLGIYCIQRTNFTTSSAGFQISTCEVINSATIGCLVNGLTSNNITFQKRQCGTVSTITPARTSAISLSTPAQTPSLTSEISSSTLFTSSTSNVLPTTTPPPIIIITGIIYTTTTPPPSLTTTELSVTIVVPILAIVVYIVIIISVSCIICRSKTRACAETYSTQETGPQPGQEKREELADSGFLTMPRRSDSDTQTPVEETGQ